MSADQLVLLWWSVWIAAALGSLVALVAAIVCEPACACQCGQQGCGCHDKRATT